LSSTINKDLNAAKVLPVIARDHQPEVTSEMAL